MSRGKRYDGEQKLNLKKVVAVIIALAVIIMFFVGISKLFKKEGVTQEKNVALKYFPVYTNNKWGVINTKGETVIQPEYEEYIVIPDNTKPIFICTYDVEYEKGTYSTKAINEKNEELFANYDSVEAIENYDSSNNLWYESGILKVSQAGKYGVIDLNGKPIIDCEYDSITSLNGVTNSLLVKKDGKYGIIDNNGSIIIENKYQSVEPLSTRYEDGYIVKDEDGKYGVINYTKSVALENKYDEIKKGQEKGKYYIVKDGKDWAVVDTDGKEYLKGKYDEITSINNENAIVKEENKYGVVSIQEDKKILEINFDNIIYATGNNYIVSQDSKYGIMDSNGNKLIDFKYSNIVYRSTANLYEASNENYTSDLLDSDLNVKLSNVIIVEVNESKGYIKVRENDEDKYYNFKFEPKESKEILSSNTIFLSKNEEGKYGFVDKNGNVVVNYIYDDAREQNEYGYASVKKDGLWGAVDAKGQVAIAPSYKLENNILVEFIGKWHLGEDLNLYYFTDK